MDRGPLVREEIEAGAELVRLFDQSYPVAAAFWLKPTDDDFRYLYLASDRITDSLREAYHEVGLLMDKIRSPDLNPLRMKVISAENPLARAVAEHARRFPDQLPARLGWERLGGTNADDVYIYPPPRPAPVA